MSSAYSHLECSRLQKTQLFGDPGSLIRPYAKSYLEGRSSAVLKSIPSCWCLSLTANTVPDNGDFHTQASYGLGRWKGFRPQKSLGHEGEGSQPHSWLYRPLRQGWGTDCHSFHYCDRTFDKNSSVKDGFWRAHSLRAQSAVGRQQEAGHVVLSVRKRPEMEAGACLLSLFSFLLGSPGHGIVSLTFRLGLPMSLNPV